MKAPRVPSVTGSMLARSAVQRLLLSMTMLVLLWLAIAWAVAIP